MRKRTQVITGLLAIVTLSLTVGHSSAEDKKREGNKIYYKGNVFDIIPEKATSYTDGKVADVEPAYRMEKLNGKKIYCYPEVSQPLSTNTNQLFVDYAAKLLAGGLDNIGTKGYAIKIHNIVINEDGRIVFYDYSGVYKAYPAIKGTLDREAINAMDKKVEKVMNEMRFKPAKMNGRNVAYWIPLAIGAA
jgi:hypothetical protein